MYDYVAGKNDSGQPTMIGLRYPYVCCLLFDVSGTFVEARLRRVLWPARAVREGGPFVIEDPDFQDRLGSQITAWSDELAFREQPISIDRFSLPELSLGIEHMPRHFEHFRRNPDDYTEEDQREYPAMIDEWLAEGNAVLWWGTDYYLDKHGEII